jgi:hypothetical protein
VEGPAVAAEKPLLILSIQVANLPESNRPPLVIPTGAKRSGGICSCCGPRFAQVRPGGVHSLNKLDLLGACPSLDLLFSLQRGVDVFVMLKPHQPVTSVVCGKAWNQGRLMLPGSASNTVGHATIQNARAAANYIHIVMVVMLRRFTPPYRFARVAAGQSSPRKPPSTRCRNQARRCHLRGGRCRFASPRRRGDEPPLRSSAR